LAVQRALALVGERRAAQVGGGRAPASCKLDRPLEPAVLLQQAAAGTSRVVLSPFSGKQSPGDALNRCPRPRTAGGNVGASLRSDAWPAPLSLGPARRQRSRSVRDRHEQRAGWWKPITDVLAVAGLSPPGPAAAAWSAMVSWCTCRHDHRAIGAHQAPFQSRSPFPSTPAWQGPARRERWPWLRSLEVFERGHYAAPMLDDMPGDAELRVGDPQRRLRGDQLELTAGAGLVKGSEASGNCRRWP